jgi:hypothetical protein
MRGGRLSNLGTASAYFLREIERKGRIAKSAAFADIGEATTVPIDAFEWCPSGALIERDFLPTSHICIYLKRPGSGAYDFALALPRLTPPDQAQACLETYIGNTRDLPSNASDAFALVSAFISEGQTAPASDVLAVSISMLQRQSRLGGLPLSVTTA